MALSLHYHILAADGVFLRPWHDLDARPAFLALPEPTDDEVATLLDQIIRRVTELLRLHGRLDDDAVDEVPQQVLLFAARSPVAPRGSPGGGDELPPLCARRDGFSLHAGRAVHANDRAGLDRLAAYALRPPLAQGRLSLTDDGQVLYRMKRTFSDGTSTIQFTPRDFVARLCALAPPPRFHVTRYHGIFSAHARGRYALTGRGLHNQPSAGADATTPGAATPDTAPVPTASATSPPPATPSAPSVAAAAGSSNLSVDPRPPDADYVAGPDEPGRARRLAWSDLWKRVWREDVLVCGRCGGAMRLVAVIEAPAVIEQILRHLGLWRRGPPPGRHVVVEPADREPSDSD